MKVGLAYFVVYGASQYQVKGAEYQGMGPSMDCCMTLFLLTLSSVSVMSAKMSFRSHLQCLMGLQFKTALLSPLSSLMTYGTDWISFLIHNNVLQSTREKGFREGMPEYCVTGGNGLIASHLVKVLLERGCTVRATVRDPENVEKVGFLWEMKGARERLRLFKADLMADGSFDQAVNGVDGVFHVACPVVSPREGDDIQAIIVEPCVKGTLNVLKSCLKVSSIKRIVLTSSCYAVQLRNDIEQIYSLNESHWSDLEYCKRRNMWYAYAKTLAERLAWQIAEERGLDLVVVNPSFVVGPLLSPQPSSTIKFVLDLIRGAQGGYQKRYAGFVHVEDVADAHVLAMEESKASGRLICSSSVVHWSDIVLMLRAKYPEYPFETKPIRHQSEEYLHKYDTSKIMELGFPGFKPIPEMFDDCIRSFRHKGLL